MTHPKVEKAIAAMESARSKADQATVWAERMDALANHLAELRQYSWVASVKITCGTKYSVPRVPEDVGKAIGQMVINAYEAELSELREKLESLEVE
jgi:hypothetical protein